MDIYDVLKNAGLCNRLKPSHVDALLSMVKEIEYPPDTVVIPEDNRSRDLYVISSGKVAIVANVPFEEGQVEIAESMRIGQVFGDVAFVDGFPRSATVKTQVNTVVLLIPYQSLVDLMEKDPEFGYLFMSNISALLAMKIRNTTLALRNMML